MTDREIIELFFNENGRVGSTKLKDTWLEKHPGVKEYLLNRYSDIDENTSLSEILYRIKNNIEYRPKCICGKYIRYSPGGYCKHCSKECAAIDNTIVEERKRTNLEKYGVQWFSKTKEYRDKCKETCIKKYGVSSYTKLNECKEKIANTNLEKYGSSCSLHGEEIKEKTKQTNLEKYGVENVFANEEIKNKIKETNLEKYGACNCMQNDEIKERSVRTMIARYGVKVMTQLPEISKLVQEKRFITQQLNNTFNTSKREEKIYSLLCTIFDNVKRQYKSDVYPWKCDFYVPSINLFIEFQGNWTHGNYPYSGSEEDLQIINKWKLKNTKYYDSAIRTWTVTDPLKRETAKKNNLNYIEFWNVREVEQFVLEYQSK